MQPGRSIFTPGTVIALIALFFALGGSAFAVGEHVQGLAAAQQRCANGSVRGVATVTGNPAPGHREHPRHLLELAPTLFSRRFNCTGKAIQVRRDGFGVYEVRFVGNSAPSAIASGVGEFTATSETLGAAASSAIRVQDVGGRAQPTARSWSTIV